MSFLTNTAPAAAMCTLTCDADDDADETLDPRPS